MLKQLHLKNWRSLRDVTIDFTPITVFIGANSSGKTNIIDALKFERDSYTEGILDTVMSLSYERITSIQASDELVKLAFTLDKFPEIKTAIKLETTLKFDKRTVPFWYKTSIYEQENEVGTVEKLEMMPLKDEIGKTSPINNIEEFKFSRRFREIFSRYIMQRWQILSENFSPYMEMTNRENGHRYIIETNGRNTPLILELIQSAYPNIFTQLVEDIHYVVNHVDELRIWRQQENRELKILLSEQIFKRTAPTISSGTSRVIAMLTALHALDMPQKISPNSYLPDDDGFISASFPGLVIIEEPDAALNPGVLERLVNVMRRFTEGDNPRQIILTTHNPTFLNYFKPEEVRVVERDEEGISQVYPVPHDILDGLETIDTLGEVWLTRALGGLGE